MKKACAGCGKQIPETALHCVFCGAKQSIAVAGPDAALIDGTSGDPVSGETPVPEMTRPEPQSSRAGVTLMGLRVADIDKELEAAAPSAGAAPVRIADDATPVRGLPVVDDEPLPVERRFERRRVAPPFQHLSRGLLALSGGLLLTLFSLPWRGTSSLQLLETLTGVDFVRQVYLLAGGAVLVLTALLPLPLAFRAFVGTFVAALPLVLGFASMLAGWHGVLAAVAVIALPATHLLRAPRSESLDRLGRGAVVLAALAVGLVYLLPISSVMPVVYIGRLLGSMSVTHTVVGLFIGIPLLLSVLSLFGSLGRDVASVAVLLSLLILLWPPAAVLIFFADGTQYFVATAILFTSTTAALCAAQLLSLFVVGFAAGEPGASRATS